MFNVIDNPFGNHMEASLSIREAYYSTIKVSCHVLFCDEKHPLVLWPVSQITFLANFRELTYCSTVVSHTRNLAQNHCDDTDDNRSQQCAPEVIDVEINAKQTVSQPCGDIENHGVHHQSEDP